ncbi:MAG: spore germination protein [Firmicutes bacterium]|nr:spore germination protein [Bacillota bacterium]
MEKSITPRQAGMLLILVSLVLGSTPLPSLLYAKAGPELWLSFLLVFILNAAVVLLILYITKKSGGVGLLELIKQKLGGVVSRIILIILFVLFTLRLIFLLFDLNFFLIETIYSSLNFFWYAVPVLFVAGFMAFKGARSIGRAGEILALFVMGAVLLCLILAATNLNFGNFLPLFENGIMPSLYGLKPALTLLGNAALLFVFSENLVKGINTIKTDKKTEKVVKHKNKPSTVFWLLGLGNLFILFVMLFLVLTFGGYAENLSTALINIVSTNSALGAVFKVDTLIVLAFLPAFIISLGVFLYAGTWCFQNIFNIKNALWSILLISAIAYTSLFFEKHLFISFFGYIILGVECVLVLLLFFISLKRRRAND